MLPNGKGHSKAHALWAEHGRPEGFTLELCATDDVIDNAAARTKLAGAISELQDAQEAGEIGALLEQLKAQQHNH